MSPFNEEKKFTNIMLKNVQKYEVQEGQRNSKNMVQQREKGYYYI